MIAFIVRHYLTKKYQASSHEPRHLDALATVPHSSNLAAVSTEHTYEYPCHVFRAEEEFDQEQNPAYGIGEKEANIEVSVDEESFNLEECAAYKLANTVV